MYRYEDIEIRKFEFEDIPYKVEWINNDANNQYLEYDLPLTVEKTENWFNGIKNRKDRWDATILYKGKPVGLTGLLNIDYKNKTAEDYILIGDTSLKGLGIATKAGVLNFAHAFYDLNLNKLWGTIEIGNEPSIRRMFRLGGSVEGYLHQSVYKNNRFIDVLYVAYFKERFSLPTELYEV